MHWTGAPAPGARRPLLSCGGCGAVVTAATRRRHVAVSGAPAPAATPAGARGSTTPHLLGMAAAADARRRRVHSAAAAHRL